jgi:endo-alpha-1,4-polygalactosaminidase (GH114 family)
MLNTHRDLKLKIEAMERKYDHQFKVVFDVIKQLLEPPAAEKKRKIGFNRGDE